MTQEEAVIMALQDLGGKAHQKDIYKRAMKYATFGGKTPDATIRALLQRCDRVRHSKDAPGCCDTHIHYHKKKMTKTSCHKHLLFPVIVNEILQFLRFFP